jgi:hypothetical protein
VLIDFQAAEWARREANKEAAAACKAQRRIVVKIQQLAEWMTSLRLRHLRLQMHPSRVGPGAGAGLRYNGAGDSDRLLSAARELAGKEIRLATLVDRLQEMVKDQKEHDREARLFGDGRLQDAHAEVDRLRKEKLKGKKKKKRNPARVLPDDLRAEHHRAAVAELVARLEAELVERAGEEDEDYEKTDWR